jgi:acid stress-induced BolA-like protein IbaG/YrbA
MSAEPALLHLEITLSRQREKGSKDRALAEVWAGTEGKARRIDMVTAESIKNHIEKTLPCEFVHVEGDDGYHFSAVIVSPEFRGKNMVQQHQLVYRALGDRMKQEIHALSMKTLTPEQWAESTGSNPS